MNYYRQLARVEASIKRRYNDFLSESPLVCGSYLSWLHSCRETASERKQYNIAYLIQDLIIKEIEEIEP